MEIIKEYLPDIIELRRRLHQSPELSGKEYKTSQIIKNFIINFHPDNIIENIGNTGLAVIYRGKHRGKTIMLRCDIDALPIEEKNNFSYKSVYKGISHKCGHDGHSAILAGLSILLHYINIEKGRVVLLFQPAEETGQGAKLVVEDLKFKNIEPDIVFGLHNLPGFEKKDIIVKNDVFALASKGIIVKLFGKTSQAAYPEKGISPGIGMAEIMIKLNDLPKQKELFSQFVLLSLIYAKLGKVSFGTCPAYAEIMATLRSIDNIDIETLTKKAVEIIQNTSIKYNLKYQVDFTEKFLPTINNNKAVKIIEKAARKNNFNLTKLREPFRWSEDFGVFTKKYKGAFFGIGAGIKHPDLHSEDYDFPDEIIETGIKMFYKIIKEYLDK